VNSKVLGAAITVADHKATSIRQKRKYRMQFPHIKPTTAVFAPFFEPLAPEPGTNYNIKGKYLLYI
jgi:hypothetical protein